MKCKYCGHTESRKVTVGQIKSATGQIHYLQCKNCEHVIYEAPDHIPHDQRERYLKRIQEGKDDL